MNENEKRLRTYIRRVAPHSHDMEGGGFALLDALLAAHRAEVDELRQDVMRFKALVRGQKTGALEVYAAGEVDAKMSATRDAALEEASDTARIAHPGALQGRDRVLFGMGVRAAVGRICALKSHPAEMAPDLARLRDGLFALGFAAEYPSEGGSVVDCALAVARERRESVLVAEVTEVLADMFAVAEHRRAVAVLALRLGVDLNAKPAVSGPDIYERGGFMPTKGER